MNEYYICSTRGLGNSHYIPESREKVQMWGKLTIKKENAASGLVKYTAERRIHGFLNEKNDAKPVSITIYTHTAGADIMSEIPEDSSLTCDYHVERLYSNDEIKSIYSFKEEIPLKKHIKKGERLFTEFSLLDTLSKITASGEAKNTCFDLNYLENAYNFKPEQKIKYIGEEEIKVFDNTYPLIGYCLFGPKNMPIFYWLAENGEMIIVKNSVITILAKGIYENEQ